MKSCKQKTIFLSVKHNVDVEYETKKNHYYGIFFFKKNFILIE